MHRKIGKSRTNLRIYKVEIDSSRFQLVSSLVDKKFRQAHGIRQGRVCKIKKTKQNKINKETKQTNKRNIGFKKNQIDSNYPPTKSLTQESKYIFGRALFDYSHH